MFTFTYEQDYTHIKQLLIYSTIYHVTCMSDEIRQETEDHEYVTDVWNKAIYLENN